MYYSDEIIKQMQENKILALKLDEAVKGVVHEVSGHVEKVGKGATRLLYYTSCFTDEYKDVCQKQKLEDSRFQRGIIKLIKNRNIISEMLRIYFNIMLSGKTVQQLEYIKKMLMRANVYISTSTLTSHGFTLSVVTAVSLGLNMRPHIRNKIGNVGAGAAALMGGYGIVQEAADSANRLQVLHPKYYHSLYMHELEMMYFLIEPVFIKSGALANHYMTDDNITDVIIKMVK